MVVRYLGIDLSLKASLKASLKDIFVCKLGGAPPEKKPGKMKNASRCGNVVRYLGIDTSLKASLKDIFVCKLGGAPPKKKQEQRRIKVDLAT